MSTATTTIPKNISVPPSCQFPWQPDCGDGTYRNPIFYADYSDPDVVRVGDDYFLTASSFNCTPGLPILHSKDLVNWTIVGHALKNLPHPRYEKVQPGCGVWAPAIRFHAGKFWIFYPTPDEGIFVVTAEHPVGPWSEPHCVQAGRGLIDPCPLWDDDGKAYLVHAYAKSRSGIKHQLRVRPMAPDGSKSLGEGKIVFSDSKKHPTLEGPKFLKKDGWYYILAPAGGIEHGWQVALRSKNIYGSYEDKIVLSQGDTGINGPHQGALVDTLNGDWWFMHFQDAGLYGRITHLQPVHWKDGWPLMGRNGEPVRCHAKPVCIPGQKPFAPQTSDEFDDTKLGLQWQWHANHRDDWHSLARRPGWLRLFSQPAATALNDQPNLLLQKFPARSFTVETLLDCSGLQIGGEAGLVVMGRAHAALAIRRNEDSFQIVFRNNGSEQFQQKMPMSEITLRLRVGDSGICEFSFKMKSDYVSVPQKFQASVGEWIGAKTGIYCLKSDGLKPDGYAEFRYFRFSAFEDDSISGKFNEVPVK
jgi:beta-xylosidase